MSLTSKLGLTAARSRSRENNIQLFSYTLAPLRYAFCGSNANPVPRKRLGTVVRILYFAAKGKKKRPSDDGRFSLAAELGFEPRHTESESAVLPLHNSARYYSQYLQIGFSSRESARA